VAKHWRWITGIALLLLVLGWLMVGRGPDVEDGTVLVMDLEGSYVETHSTPYFSRLLGAPDRPLIALLSELAKAERDERLSTVLFRIRPLDIGWGKADEIRAAIARIGEQGRRTVAYLEVEKYGANVEYFVATGAEEIYLAPGSRNPLVGLAAEYLFLGGFFEKIGVEIEYERVGKYKSAVEGLAESKMSDANREMTTALLDSVYERFVEAIAEGRSLTPEQVHAVVDAAPATPTQMQEHGLSDGIGFFDEILERVQDGDGDAERPVMEGAEYAGVDPSSVGFDPVASFALIYGTGPVVTGDGSGGPAGRQVFSSTAVSEAFEAATEDPEIDAIIFRIDSPGGSALASDLVWRATQRAREKGKPVVASFSDLAASGGYYVACGADRIISQPATLTGSIGVFVLRPILAGLFEKLGVGVEAMTRGEHADLLLASRPLSPRTRRRLRADVRDAYQTFLGRVAEGRELTPEAVDAIGQGRVWTGAQASEIGLVDALGGLRAAVLEAKSAVGLEADADVALVAYPLPKPLVEQISEAFGASLSASMPSLSLPSAVRQTLATLQVLPAGTPLLIPPGLTEIH
jgi:protease-4